jgi:hypothetical protein
MPARIHGASSAMQSLTDVVQYYELFTLASGATSDPTTALGVNIYSTGNITDISQKNFEVLIQSIGLRGMPVIMNNPVPVLDIAQEGAVQLSGEGFKWKFAVERGNIFENAGPNGTIGPTGFLIDELNGIVMPSGVLLKTKQPDQNIEFKVSGF